MTRSVASRLLAGLNLDPEDVEFYLSESEPMRQELADEKASRRAKREGQSGKKEKREESPADDEKDAQEAEEAKKSLGRRNNK